MPLRSPEEQKNFVDTLMAECRNINMSGLIRGGHIKAPPTNADVASKDYVYELLDMSDAVARGVLMSPEITEPDKRLCEKVLDWSGQQRSLVVARTSVHPFAESVKVRFVNHFVGPCSSWHPLIELVSFSPSAARAFVLDVQMRMLESAARTEQVNGVVVVGLRDWEDLTPYQKMRTVTAAFNFARRVRRTREELVTSGLLPGHSHPQHLTSLSKFAPQARAAGSEGAGRASVEVFQRYSGL